MATIRTSISDDWGEVTHVVLEGHADFERPVVHRFIPAMHEPHTLLVATENDARIYEVIVNGRPAQLIEGTAGLKYMAMLEAGEIAEVVVRTEPAPGTERADVHLGFFAKIRKKAEDYLEKTLANLSEKCMVCKALVRSALALVTGGADVLGEGLDAAIGTLEDALEEQIADTMFEDILDAIRGAVNPGKIAAAQICKELGYCK